jgi:hypothetical protein
MRNVILMGCIGLVGGFFCFSFCGNVKVSEKSGTEKRADEHSLSSSRDVRSYSMKWGKWSTHQKIFPREISIDPPNPLAFEKGEDLGQDRILHIRKLENPEGPIVHSPVLKDNGFYKESASLVCKKGQERYLARAFYFVRGNLRIVEASHYLEIRTTGGGSLEDFSGEVLALCLSRKPAQVFVGWESVPMSAWEVPVTGKP